MAGYFSVGATSVDGLVQENNWIEYSIPLAGKTLTGNKFWDQTVSVPRWVVNTTTDHDDGECARGPESQPRSPGCR